MKKALIPTIIIISVLTVGVISVYYLSSTPNTSPTPEFSSKPLPLIYVTIYPADHGDENVAQGSTFQENITITSKTDIELVIPLGNLTITDRDYPSWGFGIPQGEIFNYTFTPDQLILKPYGLNSSLLTIHLAEDAPLGNCVFFFDMGNPHQTHLSGGSVYVTITSPNTDTSPTTKPNIR